MSDALVKTDVSVMVSVVVDDIVEEDVELFVLEGVSSRLFSEEGHDKVQNCNVAFILFVGIQ